MAALLLKSQVSSQIMRNSGHILVPFTLRISSLHGNSKTKLYLSNQVETTKTERNCDKTGKLGFFSPSQGYSNLFIDVWLVTCLLPLQVSSTDRTAVFGEFLSIGKSETIVISSLIITMIYSYQVLTSCKPPTRWGDDEPTTRRIQHGERGTPW